ncbi:MAG: nucleotide exchange factor GrpE [Chloroflexi bacterium]|nr:nucleotide exchange factor GrpE [Chloroflexota bacterium]
MSAYPEEAAAPGEQAGQDDGAAAGPSDAQEALQTAQAQADEYLRLLQRTKADFINYQRRSEQERAEQERYAAASVLRRLLPLIDDFERAVASVPSELAEHPWVQGVLLIERKLKAMLEQVGLAPVETIGQPFDPLEHEAVGQEPAPPEREGLVVAEVQHGYRLHDRLLRPAQVRVGRAVREEDT